jgi:hypothetical protein
MPVAAGAVARLRTAQPLRSDELLFFLFARGREHRHDGRVNSMAEGVRAHRLSVFDLCRARRSPSAQTSSNGRCCSR